MTTQTILVCCALALPLGAVAASPPASAAEKEEAVTVDLSGRWVYNRDLSDDARQKMREGMQKRGGPGGGGMRGPGGGGMGGPGGGMGPPPGGMGGPGGGRGGPGGGMGPPPGEMGGDDARESMRAILEPAEELAVSQPGDEIAIDEMDGRTRRLHPDGRKYKVDGGTSEIKTSWKDGKLVVETKGQRGGVVETWELVPGRSRIIVMVKMEGGFGPSITLKRIYDRASESEPQ